jgi:hypothetical protein
VRSGVAVALALAVIGNCAHAERLQPGSPLSSTTLAYFLVASGFLDSQEWI